MLDIQPFEKNASHAAALWCMEPINIFTTVLRRRRYDLLTEIGGSQVKFLDFPRNRGSRIVKLQIEPDIQSSLTLVGVGHKRDSDLE